VKPIRLSQHALSYIPKRGFTIAEVEATIRNSVWGYADAQRLECQQDFPYNQDWNGKTYATKRVRPIFVENSTEIVVITVYTYFF
jgi:hypothetical protein